MNSGNELEPIVLLMHDSWCEWFSGWCVRPNFFRSLAIC